MKKQIAEESRTEFNLLDEGWICVLRPDLSVNEVSLKEVFAHAHEYTQLAGEMETQNAAILRVLLSILMAVFYRYTPDGQYEPFSEESDTGDVLNRWADIWDAGRFPDKVISDYLEKYRDRFWLIHPERPFWQVANLDKGTDYDAKTLFGDIKESNNAATRHHFSQRNGLELSRVSFPEATRWLIHLNAYSINVKPKSSVGRMGKLGFVMVKGRNLFETLMFNFTTLRDGTELWGEPRPSWEQEKVREEQYSEVPVPDNYPELYTIQSRRIKLFTEDSFVTGYRMMAGDYLEEKDLFCEQMTIWGERQDKKKKEMWLEPRTHTPGVQMWREFTSLIHSDDNNRVPGVVKWIEELVNADLIKRNQIVLQTVGMTYGNMSYVYDESFSDSLSLSAGFFLSLNVAWQNKVVQEIKLCERIANVLIWKFADNICKFYYGEKGSTYIGQRDSMRRYLSERYYELIDVAFRKWLLSINPGNDDEGKIVEWRKSSYQAARRVAEEQIATMSRDVFTIRKSGDMTYSVPRILNLYTGGLKKLYGSLNHSKKGAEGE